MAAPMDGGVKAEFPWSRQRVLDLIRLYEAEEVLWNGRCRDYHNKAMRQAALDRLSAKLAVPVNEVNKKLMNLRTYYSKELAKVKRSRVRPGAGGQVYRSQWPFFHHMDLFLSSQVVPRKTAVQEPCEENGGAEGNLEGGEVRLSSEDLDPTVAGGTSSLGAGAAPRRRAPETLHRAHSKRNREDLLLQEAARAYRTAAAGGLPPAPLPPRPDDEDDIFGKHVANELRLVGNLRAKQFAKLQIQNILFEAQFGLSQPPHFGHGFESQAPAPAAASLSSPEGLSDSDCHLDHPHQSPHRDRTPFSRKAGAYYKSEPSE
ncbi:uncharacterized protein [Lepisosteus oculatus]|uniref:uncharacterized protein n=1 Tax=Lepisosteus oculatus TaxID=7918 RepID=UPI00371EB4D5